MASVGSEVLVASVGVGVIVRRGEEILLMRRHGSHGAGSWSAPGGHIDEGESLEACAAREATEETGVTIRNVRFRAITNDVFATEGRHYITVWMEAEYDGGEAYVAAEYEATEVGWFRWDALPEPLFLPFENLMAGRAYPTTTPRPGVDR